MPIKPHGSTVPLDDLLPRELRALIGTGPGRHEPRERADVVLVVHGTFANPAREPGAPRDGSHWWRAGGSFTRALDAALERHGSRARCGLPFLLDTDDLRRWRSLDWDGWSGANSEVERRRAAYALAEHIRALRQRPGIGTIHLVAHSHGGNVVTRALRYLDDPRDGIGQVICLGTPFLHFDDKAAWRAWLGRVHWPMLIVLAAFVALFAWMFPDFDAADDFSGYVIAGMAAGAVYFLWNYARTSEGNRDDPRAVALQFARDEAIQLLRSCTAAAAQPHLYLRDILGGPAPRIEVPRPKRPIIHDAFDRATFAVSGFVRSARAAGAAVSNWWNRSICGFAERCTTHAYRIPLLGSVCALLLILAFRPYRPPLRPFLSSRMPRLAALFLQPLQQQTDALFPAEPSPEPAAWWAQAPRGTPFDPDTIKAGVAVVSAAMYLALYPIDKLLGLPSWLGAVMTRFAILIGARAAASSAPGIDMLFAAFRPSRTGELPDGITLVPIPVDIEAELDQRHGPASVDMRVLRESLEPAKRASLVQLVQTAFTDVTLLHAQYYQEPRIIDYIAQRIAGVASPAWRAEAAMGAAAGEGVAVNV